MNISRSQVVRESIVLASIVLCVEIAGPISPAASQVIPDATLGAERSQVTPNANASNTDLVEGGALRGRNLFHSFQEFNVNLGQRVYFANPAGVQSIFGRVTGGTVSNILGTLGVNGGANLFLLNPQGFLFGPNATLDIRGSFLATTGDLFLFPDSQTFGVDTPTVPLLTVSAPSGVQYGGTPGPIRSQGNLAVGQDLTLAAGNLDVQGNIQAGWNLTLQAQDTVKIRDSVAQPVVAAAGGKLLVEGGRAVDIFALNHPSSGFFSGGDLILRSGSPVSGDAHFWSGGNFRIEQMNGQTGNLLSPNDPIIFAVGDVNLGDYTGESLHILAGGSVTLGNVTITGPGDQNTTIHPKNPDPFLSFLSSVPITRDDEPPDVDGSAQSTLDVRAGIDWSKLGGFSAPSPIIIGTVTPGSTPTTTTLSAGITVTGNITLLTPDNGLVLLTNQYFPTAVPGDITVQNISTVSDDSGSIYIDSRRNFTPLGTLDTTTTGNEQGGDIVIRAGGVVSIVDGAVLKAETSSTGPAGYIDIDAREIRLDGANTRLSNAVQASANGDGGYITLTSNSLSVTGGAQIDARMNGTGAVGYIDINMAGTILIDGANSRITNSIGETGTGTGEKGEITIATGTLTISNGAALASSVAGQGNAGAIAIKATESVNLQQGGRISSSVRGSASGNGGNIQIDTDRLTLTDQGKIEALSEGQGNAGKITIHANTIRLNNEASITAATQSGGGGDIFIEVKNFLILRRNSLVSTTAGSEQQGGNGGRIDIRAPKGFVITVPSENNDIIANAFGGQGGRIALKANRVFGFQQRSRLTPTQLREIRTNSSSDISASSDVGAEGSIAIETLQIDPSQGLTEVPVDLVDPAGLISQGCQPSTGAKANRGEYVVTGRGGLPPAPGETQTSNDDAAPWVSQPLPRSSAQPLPAKATTALPAPDQPLVEAQGIAIAANGTAFLTAQSTTVTPHTAHFPKVVCPPTQATVQQ